jgi:hypothetical protein
MSLSLQPAITASPLNGLPTQPIDSAATQPLSFGEVLKVEEKKLQQEQETNAQSVAALLATIQPPAIAPSIRGFDAGAVVEPAQSAAQTALTIDSAQSATTQPKQNPQVRNQQIALPEKAAAKIQTNFSMPVPEVEETDQHQPSKTQPASQPKEVKAEVIGEAEDQTTQPIAEKRLPATNSVSKPTTDAEKTGAKISVRKDVSSSTSTQPSETKSAPGLTRTAEKVGKPNLSQTGLSIASADAPITQPIPSNVTIQNESMPPANKTQQEFVADAKPVETDQENAPAFETRQPAVKTQSEDSPISLKREVETGSHTQNATITSSSQNETPLPERAETLQSDSVIPETTQMKATVTEISQPVSKTNIRVEKSISSDGVEESQSNPISANNETKLGDHFKNAILSNDSSLSTAETQQAFPQSDRVMPEVSSAEKDSETSQPVKTPEVPSSKVIHSNKINLASIEDNETSTQQKPFVDFTSSTISTDVNVPAEKTAATINSDKQVSAAVKMDMPVQANIPEGENSQPVQVTVAPNVKLTSPTISNQPATTETMMAVPAQADNFTSEISRSAAEKIVPSIKSETPEVGNEPMPAEEKMTAPVQAKILETETSQPEKEAIAPSMKSAAPEISNESEKGNFITSEKSQPVKETVVRNAKSVSVETTNEFSTTEIKNTTRAQIEVLESEKPQSAQETFAPNAKSVQSTQTDIPVHEVSQPAKDTVVQTVKSAAPEVNNTLSKSDAKGIGQATSEIPTSENSQPTKKLFSPSAGTTSTQADTLANKNPQPAREAAAQSMQPAITERDATKMKIAVPVQPETIASEAPHPAKEAVASNVKPEMTLPSDEPDITKMKIAASVQSEIPASEMQQPVKETTAPSVKPLRVEPDSAKVKIDFPAQPEFPANKVSQPVEETASSSVKSAMAESDATEMKVTAPLQPEDSTSEVPQPVKETVAPSAKSAVTEIGNKASKTKATMVAPAQVEVSASEVPQPVKETVAPSAKSVVAESDMTKVKAAASVQPEVPVSEVPQPAKETVVLNAKPAMTESDAVTVKIDSPMQLDVPASEMSQPVNPLMPERDTTQKMAVPVQSDIPASEISQPVKDMAAPAVKPVASQINDEVNATRTRMAVPMEADVQANEVSQPAKDAAAPVTKSVEASATEAKPDVPFRMNVPASEFSQPVTKTSQPLTSQVPAVEIEEAVLKNKDGKSAPASVVENVAAESRLGGTNMLQIKNEAFVVEQKNAAVEIQFEKVAQAVRVEINPDEKVPAKDAERESVLDLDAAAVVGGVDRGEAGVKAAGKSFGAQVNPLAGDVIEQITSQVKARVKSGETSIRMQLNPGELGAIDVQMTHSAKGVSVSFITEQASTGQLLESQVNQLRQSLKDAGVQLVNLNISQHGQSYQEGGGFRQSQQFVQTSQRDVPLVEADEGIQPQRVGQTSEIDYLV